MNVQRKWLGRKALCALSLASSFALTGAALLVVVASPAAATTFTVSNTNDSGAGSLRQALIDASADVTGAHTVVLPVGLGTITLTSGELVYNNASNESLSIEGNGNTINQATSGSRALHVLSGGLLTVDALTITGATAGAVGGAIDTDLAAISIVGSTITGNSATGAGGGVFGSGSVSVTNSTITGNTATRLGGGIAAQGAVTLVYATVDANSAPGGSNVGLLGTGSNVLASFGSVVTAPDGGGADCALNGTITTSNDFNYSDDSSCGFTGAADTQNGAAPGLGALADNGGPTPTMLPQSASPLVDAIPNASCQSDGASGIVTDQRNFARPSPIGGACDIGAIEVQVTAAPPAPPVAAAVPIVTSLPRFTG